MKGLHIPTGVSLKSDTSNIDEDNVDTIGKKETTGDFRFDNMFK